MSQIYSNRRDRNTLVPFDSLIDNKKDNFTAPEGEISDLIDEDLIFKKKRIIGGMKSIYE